MYELAERKGYLRVATEWEVYEASDDYWYQNKCREVSPISGQVLKGDSSLAESMLIIDSCLGI
jgi:hypothetical protein